MARSTATAERRLRFALLAGSMTFFVSGCSAVNEEGKKPAAEVRSVEEAKNQARQLSSQILDAMKLAGQTTPLGPGVSRCGEDSDHTYRIRHPWSVWGVPEADMEKAMERLRSELPQKGWKVRKYERDTSSAGNLELIADSAEFKFSVDITFMDGRRSKSDQHSTNKTSGIKISLVSACYKIPDGKTFDEI